jgi:hypothetical protein
MDSVIVIAPTAYDETLRSRIPDRYRVYPGAAGAIVIEEGPKRIYIWENKHIANEFDPSKLGAAVGAIQNPTFYSIDFHDFGFCRDLLLEIADDPQIVVDNHYGTSRTGSEFARLLRQRPNWDWRFTDSR